MGWLFLLLLMIGLYALWRDQRQRRSRTDEEYRRDVEKAGPTLIGAAMLELQNTLQPEARASIEYIVDEQQGITEEKQKASDSQDRIWPSAGQTEV